MSFLKFREEGYNLLRGKGIEIGAFEHPAILGKGCEVEYVDVISREEAGKLFPEVENSTLKEVDHILDISKGGLDKFQEGAFDFVIINHVIEHVPNPIRVLKDLFKVLKEGGHLVIAIPDKHYTFDKLRPLTTFSELELRYANNKIDTIPEDFRDMVTYVHPELLVFEDDHLYKHLESFKRRREHVNIWDSGSFKKFVIEALDMLSIDMFNVYEVTAEKNGFEYFGVFEKR